MDIARCSTDGQIYTSTVFSQLSPQQIAVMRHELWCPECGGPAFFRKAATNGQAACFGARPHKPMCSLAAQDSERVIEGEQTDLDVLRNPGQVIVVDLAFGAVASEVHVDPQATRGRAGTAPRYVGGNARPDARMRRRLSSLLRTLIEAPQFSQSTQILEIDGHPSMAVRDFFVPLLNTTRAHEGNLRGWWGSIASASEGQSGEVWLNSGGRSNMSFCIPAEVKAAVLNRFRITDYEQLAGAYVLGIASLQISQYGKMYCVIQSENQIAIRLT